MAETVELQINGSKYTLPVVTGTESEKGIDISKLRGQTGYVTLDEGYMNTGACRSAITFIDGEKGILRYRGIPIEELAENSTFVETAYLLIYGDLPSPKQLEAFSDRLTRGSMLHEDMKRFFSGFPSTGHPMAILSAMVCSLSAYYEQGEEAHDQAQMDTAIARLLAKCRTIAAFSYKKSRGEPFVYPEASLPYCANFLNMLFQHPSKPYTIDPESVRMLNLLLILHADHEQNCSTSTVRLVGSSQASLYAAISAGICALWGPRHGGANQAVIEMLEEIHRDGGGPEKFIKLAKDKDSKFRLMGFGHRVYKNYDPRAALIKKACDGYLEHLGVNDPLLDIAKHLEEAALSDPYFIDRKLYPNVDFYSGIIYRAMKIPTNMFTVMFAIGRLPGWIAHWKEMIEEPDMKIGATADLYGAVDEGLRAVVGTPLMSGAYESILYSLSDHIATLTLNLPERRNPLGDKMIEEIIAALREFHLNDDARVLILTGAGSAFCSGGDLKMIGQWQKGGKDSEERPPFDPIAQRERYRRGIQQIPRMFASLDKPVIAAVNGAAIGAGNDLCLMADIRIASEKAKFGESFRNVGLAPGDGGAYLLTRLVGLEKACELIFTGDIIDAQEALRIGMISRVVPHEELIPAANALAKKIADGPLLALKMSKFAIYRGLHQTLDESLEMMALMQAMLHGTEDHREALKAFMEKRPPNFLGR